MPVAFLPSPSRSLWHVGPIPLRAYPICVVLGIIVGLWIASRRYRMVGGRPGMILDIATVAIPVGLLGARLYSVLTDIGFYFGHGRDWVNVFRIWDGGLGIPGAVVGGALGAWLVCRRERTRLPPVAGAVAPALAFAQAIGRWGNYFNQELYGRPSKLPWAVKIDNPSPPYLPHSTFQPTFLYESIWDLVVLGLVIWAERRFRIRRGYLIAAYAAFYTFGRFWTEYLRIDDAHRFFGLRLNDWTSIVVFVASTAVLLTWGRA